MGDGEDDIRLPEESPVEGDSSEEGWPMVRARMFAAARERADRTIRESRARRQAALEGQLEVYELGRLIHGAVEESRQRGDSMSVEEALGMLAAFGETKH
ncbi:hypothetical protein [Aureimonas sp. SK2]|uniref:hypothetical protein n=1 Tax=Aureimonas sp. SK2 TaxID=3015992 RepID=UPI0024447973|nr:hypothetical protein [Aureimonas sp. SK2]